MSTTRLRMEEHTGTHLHPAGTEVEVLVLERSLARVRRVERANCNGRYCGVHECNEQAFYTRRDNLVEDGGAP